MRKLKLDLKILSNETNKTDELVSQFMQTERGTIFTFQKKIKVASPLHWTD